MWHSSGVVMRMHTMVTSEGAGALAGKWAIPKWSDSRSRGCTEGVVTSFITAAPWAQLEPAPEGAKAGTVDRETDQSSFMHTELERGCSVAKQKGALNLLHHPL